MNEQIAGILKRYPKIIRVSSAEESRWKEMEEQISFLPVEYQLEAVHYQTEYFSERNDMFVELPLLIFSGTRDVGIWPLCIWQNGGGINRVSWRGDFAAPVL